MDDEEDVGFNTGKGTTMEAIAAHMGMPSYLDTYTKATEVYDPGSTHQGLGFFGFNTGLGRGWAADQAQQPEPGSFNPSGFATGLIGLLAGNPGLTMALDSLIGNPSNIDAYGNMVESVFGLDANQTMADVNQALSDFGTQTGLSSLGQSLSSLGQASGSTSTADNVSFDDVTEDFYDDDVYGSPDIIDTITPYAPTPYVRKPYVRNPNIRYRNPNIRYADEGGLVSLANGGNIRDVVEDQTTLIDVINTGQAIPPNIGATQAQGSMQPMQANQSNQQNIYTQSAQPQSFYAQPQQVKNYGNLY